MYSRMMVNCLNNRSVISKADYSFTGMRISMLSYHSYRPMLLTNHSSHEDRVFQRGWVKNSDSNRPQAPEIT